MAFDVQDDDGRPHAEVLGTEFVVGGGRELEDGTNTPDEPGFGVGREKGGELHGADAVDPAVERVGNRLGDNRNDGPGDQVPVGAQGDGDDRLDVEDVLGPVLRAGSEVDVVLERDADQLGHRVLGLLGEIFG